MSIKKPEISYSKASWEFGKYTKKELEEIKKNWEAYINDKYSIGYYEKTTCSIITRSNEFDKNIYYINFGVDSNHSSFWGCKPEDVYKCKITIIEDFVNLAAKYKSGYNENSVDYFGWVSYKFNDDNENGISLIQPNIKMFSMQFPGAGDYESKQGAGKIVRLNIEIINE